MINKKEKKQNKIEFKVSKTFEKAVNKNLNKPKPKKNSNSEK